MAIKSYIDEIEVLQRKALKATFKLPIRFSTENLFREYCPNVLVISKMYQFAVCKFVHGCKHDLVHHNVVFPVPSHDHDTFSKSLLCKPLVKSVKYGLTSLAFQGPSLYNKLPLNVTSATCAQSFHFLLKKFLLNNDL